MLQLHLRSTNNHSVPESRAGHKSNHTEQPEPSSSLCDRNPPTCDTQVSILLNGDLLFHRFHAALGKITMLCRVAQNTGSTASPTKPSQTGHGCSHCWTNLCRHRWLPDLAAVANTSTTAGFAQGSRGQAMSAALPIQLLCQSSGKMSFVSTAALYLCFHLQHLQYNGPPIWTTDARKYLIPISVFPIISRTL